MIVGKCRCNTEAQTIIHLQFYAIYYISSVQIITTIAITTTTNTITIPFILLLMVLLVLPLLLILQPDFYQMADDLGTRVSRNVYWKTQSKNPNSGLRKSKIKSSKIWANSSAGTRLFGLTYMRCVRRQQPKASITQL